MELVSLTPHQFALTGSFLAGGHFHIVLPEYANLSQNIANLVFVTSLLLYIRHQKQLHNAIRNNTDPVQRAT